MAKKFMYVCLGVLMLAIAYHLLVPMELARSQEGERPVLMGSFGSMGRLYVMTDQGNLYDWDGGENWSYGGRWPGTPPTSTQSTTWGQIKAEFGE